MADHIHVDASSIENTPAAGNVFERFPEASKKAKEAKNEQIIPKYINGESKMPCNIVGSQTNDNPDHLNEITLINCCHINTFLACLYLSLSHNNMITKFIAEQYKFGLDLKKVFEDFGCEEFDRARFEWLKITNNSLLSNPGPILDLAGNNWDRTAGALARLRCRKVVSIMSDYSTPFIKLESNMFKNQNDPMNLQDVTTNYCEHTGNHQSTCKERPPFLFISLEEIAAQMNLDSINMELSVFGDRYQLLFVCLGNLPPEGIGHITGLMYLGPDWIYYDGAKEHPLKRVTSATLQYTGIYLAVYTKIESSNIKIEGSALDNIQEYRNSTS